jgi:type IV pilus assembly protein PilC
MSATFVYRVRGADGRARTGELLGESKAAVAAQLRQAGLTVLDVDQKSHRQSLQERFEQMQGVPAREITVLARQLATMISSGLSLVRALQVLQEQTEHKLLRRTVGAVREDVTAGLALSQAMAKHPRVFSELFVAMVRAGETGGNLEEVLERVAVQLEKDDSLRRTVRAAMVYPSLIAVFAVMVLIGMVLFIIPVFADMYADLGGELPTLTRFMIGFSDAMRTHWYAFLAVPAVAAFAFFRWKRSKAGQKSWDRFKLRIPFRIGSIVRKIAIARFSRTLGTLTASGVPIIQALRITASTAGNRVVSDPIEGVVQRVKEGQPLAMPLAGTGVFPPMVTHMLAVGEETGAMDRMLHKLADFYDDEVTAQLKSLTSMIEPLMMILVGAIVGLVVISLYLPMFGIFELVR